MPLQASGTISFYNIYNYWVTYGYNRGYSLSGYLSTLYYYYPGYSGYFPANNISFAHFYGTTPAYEWNCDCNCACK
jgi:hypothetical protein